MEKNITFEQLAAYEKAFDADRANQVAMRAVTTNGVVKAATNQEVYRRDRHQYSISLEQGNITNQKQSGRCWMFAALNTMRFAIMKKLDLDTFELSQNYTLFYDKLEKANYFLESILDTLEEPTSGRVIAHLLMAPLNDGGQWDMFCNLIEKYGVVPKDAMPETVCSSATREMAGYMTRKLREYACTLRTGHQNGKSLEELRQALAGKRALVVAPGKSAKEEREKIAAFAGKGDVASIGVNFDDPYLATDYIFLSNLRRQEELGPGREHRLIATSNLPDRGAKYRVDYRRLLNHLEPVWDNAGLMLVKLLIQLGVKELYLAGVDGYSHDPGENYAQDALRLAAKSQTLDAMNQGMCQVLGQFAQQATIRFLTKPRYVRLPGA